MERRAAPQRTILLKAHNRNMIINSILPWQQFEMVPSVTTPLTVPTVKLCQQLPTITTLFCSDLVKTLWTASDCDKNINNSLPGQHYCARHDFLYIRGWMKMLFYYHMIYSPETDNQRRHRSQLQSLTLRQADVYNDTYSVHNEVLMSHWARPPVLLASYWTTCHFHCCELTAYPTLH